MATTNPMQQVIDWLEHARQHEPADAEAMSVATVDAAGRPSVRMVLLRGIDPRGVVFYTNLSSRKAREIVANPAIALCLHWKSTERQVRIEGRAEQVTDDEADAYFASRERESQIGAWASKQSSRLDGLLKLERRVARFASAFAIGPVRRPEFWSGYRVIPQTIEFWQKKPFRLHQRTLYERHGDDWSESNLYP